MNYKQQIVQEIDPKDGVIREWHRLNGRLHREETEGPVFTISDLETGRIHVERYYRHGKIYREKGPAVVKRTTEGVTVYVAYKRYGLFHRNPEEGPAWIERNRSGTVVTMEGWLLYDEAYRHPDAGPWCIQRCPETGRITSEQYLTLNQFAELGRPQRRCPRVSSAKPFPK